MINGDKEKDEKELEDKINEVKHSKIKYQNKLFFDLLYHFTNVKLNF